MTDKPLLRISPTDLDKLMNTLEARFVALSECFVSRGYALELGAIDAPGIHYNLAGAGRMFYRGLSCDRRFAAHAGHSPPELPLPP